jgi:hypothetical protein
VFHIFISRLLSLSYLSLELLALRGKADCRTCPTDRFCDPSADNFIFDLFIGAGDESMTSVDTRNRSNVAIAHLEEFFHHGPYLYLRDSFFLTDLFYLKLYVLSPDYVEKPVGRVIGDRWLSSRGMPDIRRFLFYFEFTLP